MKYYKIRTVVYLFSELCEKPPPKYSEIWLRLISTHVTRLIGLVIVQFFFMAVLLCMTEVFVCVYHKKLIICLFNVYFISLKIYLQLCFKI